jgi:hypothetical protein
MDEELISKKELLEKENISYGQLYRWKRKNLIPEEWFVRKSTFTGQETFFPKEKILKRIERIKNMKEDISLTDLAVVFSPSLSEVELDKDAMVQRSIISKTTLDFFIENTNTGSKFNFEHILYSYVIELAFKSGDISMDEGKTALKTLQDNYKKFEGKNCEIIFTRKLGVSACVITASPAELYFDEGVKVVMRISMAACVEELKIKL